LPVKSLKFVARIDVELRRHPVDLPRPVSDRIRILLVAGDQPERRDGVVVLVVEDEQLRVGSRT
jgi:hypothetical protein